MLNIYFIKNYKLNILIFQMNNDNRFICQLMEQPNLIISSTSSSSLNESSSSDSTDNIKSSSSEDEDLLLFPLLKFLTSGQRRHRIKNYIYILNLLTLGLMKNLNNI